MSKPSSNGNCDSEINGIHSPTSKMRQCSYCGLATINSCFDCNVPFCSVTCSLMVKEHLCVYVPELIENVKGKDQLLEPNNDKKESSKQPAACDDTAKSTEEVCAEFDKLGVSISSAFSAMQNELPDEELPAQADSKISSFANMVKMAGVSDILISVLKPPFNMVPIRPTSQPTKVYVTDIGNLQHGFIACMPADAIDNFHKILKYFKSFSDATPYTPIKDEYVVVNFASLWLRGKVMAVLQGSRKDKFRIFFVDLGTERTVGSEAIRRFPPDMHLDCYTAFCVVKVSKGRVCPALHAHMQLNVQSIGSKDDVIVLNI